MIDKDVYFGKGKIKGLATISKKYWDEGKLTTNENNLIFNGKKGSTELIASQIGSVEWKRHRVIKVIKVNMQTDEFYHISCVPDVSFEANYEDPLDGFSDVAADVKAKNTELMNVLKKFLNL